MLAEEALIDNIPVIAIDPKGDLPNLLLNFPELKADDFRPWISEQDALNKGLDRNPQSTLLLTALAVWLGEGARRRLQVLAPPTGQRELAVTRSRPDGPTHS